MIKVETKGKLCKKNMREGTDVITVKMLFNNTFQSFRKNKVPGVWDVVCKINTKINTITSIYNIVSILLSNPVP